MKRKIKELGARTHAVLTVAAFVCLMAPGAALAKVGGGGGAQTSDLTTVADNTQTELVNTGNVVGAIIVAVGVFVAMATRNIRMVGVIFAGAVLANVALDGSFWTIAKSVAGGLTKNLGA